MQEQYELVYDAVIELFKRQIKALDAQEDSAASQVKVPRIIALHLAASGAPALTRIPLQTRNEPLFSATL